MATSKNKFAQFGKTSAATAIIATIAGGFAMAPANAAELPYNNSFTNITVDGSNADNNNNLHSNAVFLNFGFNVPTGAKAGDTYTITLDEGYDPYFDNTLSVKTADGQAVATISKSITNPADELVLTMEDGVENLVGATGIVKLPLRIISGEISGYTDQEIPLGFTVGGKHIDTGSKFRGDKPLDYLPTGVGMYSIADANTGAFRLSIGVGATNINHDTNRDITYTIKRTSDNFHFNTDIDPQKLVSGVRIDNDINTASNPDRPDLTGYETDFTGKYEVISANADELTVKVYDVPGGYGARIQLATNAAVVDSIDGNPYSVEATVVNGTDKPVVGTGSVKASGISGLAEGEQIKPGVSLESYINNNDADTAATAEKLTTAVDAKTASGNDTLKIGNPGNVPILSYTITNDLDPKFSQTIDGVNIKPGESLTLDVADLKYPIGDTTVNWKVTANGVSATDPTVVKVAEGYKIAGSMLNQVKGEDGKWYDADTAEAAVIFSKEGTAETRLVIKNPTTKDTTVASYVDNNGKTITDGKTVVPAGKFIYLDGGDVTVKRGQPVTFTSTVNLSVGTQKLQLKDPITAQAKINALTFEAQVNEKDADTKADAVSLTAKDQATPATGNVTGIIKNTGDNDLIDPVIKGSDGSTVTLTGVTIKVGETKTVTIDKNKGFKVGDTEIKYTVTANGVSATDPINVKVDFPAMTLTPAYKIDGSLKNQIKAADGSWIDADTPEGKALYDSVDEHSTRLVYHNPTNEDQIIKSYVNNLGETITDGKTVAKAGQDTVLDGGNLKVTEQLSDKTASVTVTHGSLEKTVTDKVLAQAVLPKEPEQTPAPAPSVNVNVDNHNENNITNSNEQHQEQNVQNNNDGSVSSNVAINNDGSVSNDNQNSNEQSQTQTVENKGVVTAEGAQQEQAVTVQNASDFTAASATDDYKTRGNGGHAVIAQPASASTATNWGLVGSGAGALVVAAGIALYSALRRKGLSK